MTDCPHDIVNRMRFHKRGGERGDYWACAECGHVFTPRNDSRESALAEFVAAFDEWREAPEGHGLAVDLCDQKMRPYAERLHEAREALDATEDADNGHV